MRMTLIAGVLLASTALSGCAGMGLGGAGTGLDPKFMQGVNDLLTSTNCGHHDEFRATVGAAGIPASTSVVLVRDCPIPPAAPAPVTPPAS